VLQVIAYRPAGVEGADPLFGLATTILDHKTGAGRRTSALYHKRWEIEAAFGELKTHLRGAHIVLTPDLARQEFYGLLILWPISQSAVST
jgi:hypothetical protein